MGSGRTLTATEKEQIDAFKEFGLSGREIARRLNRSKTVVNRYLANPKHYGDNQKGRTAEATTLREKQLILRLASNSTLPATIIRANSGVSASIATVRRVIRKGGKQTTNVSLPANQSRMSVANLQIPMGHDFDTEVTGAKPKKATTVQQQEDEGDFNGSLSDLTFKLEVDRENDYYEPSSKMPKIQSISLDLDEIEDLENKKQNIGSYKDALTFLKPLEDFALQMEDYRVIGLLAQLEAIFKIQLQKQ